MSTGKEKNLHSMECHDVPFAISEDYDWIAVPGHIGWKAATAIVNSVDDAILGDYTKQELKAAWLKGWVLHTHSDGFYGEPDTPWWTDCNLADDGAEPAMIWRP